MKYNANLSDLAVLPGVLDGESWRVRLKLTESDQAGTPGEREATRILTRTVRITRSVLACGRWADLTNDDLERAVLAYVWERLKQQGLEQDDLELPMIDSYLEGGRYDDGPPWSLEHVKHDFVVTLPDPRIGF